MQMTCDIAEWLIDDSFMPSKAAESKTYRPNWDCIQCDENLQSHETDQNLMRSSRRIEDTELKKYHYIK